VGRAWLEGSRTEGGRFGDMRKWVEGGGWVGKNREETGGGGE